MFMRRISLWMISWVMIKNTLGQSPSTTHWFTVQLPFVFNKHWQWLNEMSYRTLGESISLNQFFVRTGARYTINEKWNVATSAEQVFLRVYPSKHVDDFGRESRFWQEVNFM